MFNIFKTIIKPKSLLTNPIKILVIIDTHGYLPDEIFNIRHLEYDVCFLLGDIYQSDLDTLKTILEMNKVYGIIGNHNYIDFLEKNDVRNIHGKVIVINGITFAGWGGSLKYKPTIQLGFDGKINGISSCDFAQSLPKADVLIKNHGPLKDNKETSHSGIKGISQYLQNNSVSLHIHGHLHQNIVEKIGKTTSICVFRAAIIDQTGRVDLIC